MEKLQNQLKEIEQFIEKQEFSNLAISKSSSYWQIDHTLRVFEGIPQAVANSNPNEFKPKRSFLKWMIMTFHKIPRGKGRAPKHVLPEDHITKADLLNRFESAKSGLTNFNNLDEQSHFRHPMFGDLNVKESKKFLGIHTEHHLKILRDMVKKK